MKLLFVPPHHDFSLSPAAPAGFEVRSLHRDYLARALHGSALKSRIEGLEGAGVKSVADAQALLRLKVAALGLLAHRTSTHAWLRSASAALLGLTAPPCPVALRIDDLELSNGLTTERLADVLASVKGPLPFEAELSAATEESAHAEVVRFWLEKDQQLPALLRILARLPEGVCVELAGPFAHAHRAVLSRLPTLARARFVEDDVSFGVGPLSDGTRGLRWQPDHGGRPPPDAPWAGYLSAGALLDAPPEADRARAVVVQFCALEEQTILTFEGDRYPRHRLLAAVQRRRGLGLSTFGEWVVGAPGQDVASHEQTARALESSGVFDWVVGIRPFHWRIQREGSTFDGRAVRLGAPEEGRDLARSLPVLAPEVLGHEALAKLIAALAPRLSQLSPLAPGRVALGYLEAPTPPQTGGARVRRDVDCQVVQLPCRLDLAPRESFYAVNLRTGATLALDARLAPVLGRLDAPATPGEALAVVPADQREKLCRALLDKGVLEATG